MPTRTMCSNDIPSYLDKHSAIPNLNRQVLERMVRSASEFRSAMNYMSNKKGVSIAQTGPDMYTVNITKKEKPKMRGLNSIW